MNGIHIVSRYDIFHYTTNKFTVFGQTGVEKQLSAILNESFRILPIDMVGSQLVVDICFHPVGVKPGVELHASFVAFVDDKCQRIKVRIVGCLTLPSCQESAPRLQIRFVKSICFGANLENHGVDSCLIQFAYHFCNVVFHGSTVHFLIPCLSYGLYPSTAKFVFGSRIGLSGQCLFGRSTSTEQTTCCDEY